MLFNATDMDSNYTSVSVTPLLFWYNISEHFHAGPSGDYMGHYKINYVCFSGHSCLMILNVLLKGLYICIAYMVWRTRKVRFNFHGLSQCPFWIMDMEFWSPGVSKDEAGDKGYLLNCMYDITQFIVSYVTVAIYEVTLVHMCMSDIILIFSI